MPFLDGITIFEKKYIEVLALAALVDLDASLSGLPFRQQSTTLLASQRLERLIVRNWRGLTSHDVL